MDADEIFDQFLDGCFEAGIDNCLLANMTGSPSVRAAKAHVWSFLKTLDEKPQTLTTAGGETGIVTGDYFRRLMAVAAYNPILYFPMLALQLLVAMHYNETDTTPNADMVRFSASPGICKNVLDDIAESEGTANNTVPNPRAALSRSAEARAAVVCSDADDMTGKSASWWIKYAHKHGKVSEVFGRFWSVNRLRCSSWP